MVTNCVARFNLAATAIADLYGLVMIRLSRKFPYYVKTYCHISG
nr:MAG TPA: hypothetical protein [Caudoviricetes sp.]